MLMKIDKIYKMLNWNNNEDIQQKGIEQGMKIKDISCFLQPIRETAGKSVWENCARIIAQKPDEELIKYIFDLFEWLQDANWPGFDIIYKRILDMKSEVIVSSYLNAIEVAIEQSEKEEGDEWLVNLLRLLVDNGTLYKSLNEKEKLTIRKYLNKYKRELGKIKE